jgi:hypothetical protein
MTRDEYEKDLARRQAIHLQNVKKGYEIWQPCAHDQCPECIGTGIKSNGSPCIHYIYCSCPKCSPYSSIISPQVTWCCTATSI